MKLTLIALGASAGCLLASAALAGPCSTQIDNLTKQLEATDAGMGPTAGANGANSGAASGTMNESASNNTQASPSGSSQTTHPPTGAMNEASQNKATSAQDVQNQNTGQGTMADQAMSAADNNQTAQQSLERAKTFDQAGDEAACMNEIGKARGALPTQ
jgi:hypothetical protein